MTERPDWAQRLHRAAEPLGLADFLAEPGSGFWCDRVTGLTVAAGSITAEVRATRLRCHRTRITTPVHDKAAWTALTQALAQDRGLTEALLSGEVPPAVERICAEAGHPLLPDLAQEAALDCTCPAPATPCGHLHATLAVFTRTAAADPFTLLALRGRDQDALLAELRTRLDVPAPPAPQAPAPPLAEVLEGFFDWPTPDGAAPAAPGDQTPAPVAAELPALSTVVGGVGLTEHLRPIYRAMTAEAAG